MCLQTDALRKFYVSLKEQRPDSPMALRWCVPAPSTQALLLQLARLLLSWSSLIRPGHRPPSVPHPITMHVASSELALDRVVTKASTCDGLSQVQELG